MTSPELAVGLAEIIRHEVLAARQATNSTIRCDACDRQQGYVHVVMRTGADLWFCAHDYSKFALNLECGSDTSPAAKVINDYRIVLEPTR